MLSHQDTFNIKGEHFQIIAIYEDDKFDDYDVKTYELSSRHNPLTQNKILSKDEIQEYERVKNPDDMEYLVHHAHKLAEEADNMKESKNTGDLSEFVTSLRMLESRMSRIRDCKSIVKESVNTK
jgi:hypothetical protein